MSEIKPLSQLTEATALAGDDIIPVVSGGATKQVKISTIQGSLFPGGIVAVETIAELLLSYPDQTAAKVGNDPTPANNGDWRKEGAAGAGSWVQSNFDRVLQVENRTTAVEESKLDRVVGKNKFDINAGDVAVGFYVNDLNGNLGGNAVYATTGYIPVTAGTTYTLSRKNRIAYYDANKVYISGSPYTDTNPTQTAPAGAAFMRCSVTPLADYDFWGKFQVEEGTSATVWAEYTDYGFLDKATDRLDVAEADIITLETKAAALLLSGIDNLSPDPLNRIAESDGLTDWAAGGLFYPLYNVTLVDSVLSPYPGRKTLLQTNAPTDTSQRLGHKFDLADVGLVEGDEVTLAIDGYVYADSHVAFYFRNAAQAAVGVVSWAGSMTGPTAFLVSGTRTVPADAVTVEMIVEQNAVAAADAMIFGFGLWRGTEVVEIRESSPSRTEFLAEKDRTTASEANILTLQLSPFVAADGRGMISTGALPDSVFKTTVTPSLTYALSAFAFGVSNRGEGRELVATGTIVADSISFDIDQTPTQAFLDAAPRVAIFIYNQTDGVSEFNVELSFADWSAAIASGTLTVAFSQITITAGKTYQFGLCFSELGMKTPGTAIYADQGGYSANYSTNPDGFNSWVYTGHALAFTLGRVNKTLLALFDLGYYEASSVDPAATEVFTGLPVATGPAGYNPDDWEGWGTIFDPAADKTFNVIEVAPVTTLVDPASQVQIDVRMMDALEIVIARAVISGREWNTAAAAGGFAHGVLDTSVTMLAGVQFAVTQTSDERRMDYNTMAKTAEVIDRVYTNGLWTPASTAPSVPYMHLLYDPTATKVGVLPNSAESIQASADLAEAQVVAALNPNPDIILPRKVFGLLGDDIDIEQANLYFFNLIVGDLDRIFPDVVCNYGNQFEECFRMEPGHVTGSGTEGNPTGAGTFALTINALDESFSVLSTAATTVEITDKVTKTAQHRHLCIGDSMTRGGVFLHRLEDGLTGVEFRGIRHYTSDRVGLNREGRGGWTIAGYVDLDRNTSATSYSPFVFPIGKTGAQFWGNVAFWKEVVGAGGYDFDGFEKIARGWLDDPNPFLFDTNGYPISPAIGDCIVDPDLTAGTEWAEWSGSAWTTMSPQPTTEVSFTKYLDRFSAAYDESGPVPPDSISLMLGTNSFASSSTGATPAAQAAWVADMQTLIAAIRAELPTTPIIIGMPIMGADQNAANVTYRAGTTAARIRRNMQECGRLIIDTWDNDTDLADNIFVSPIILSLDTIRGFGTRTENASKYITEQITIPNDMIHPATEGYYQMGDALAAAVQKIRA